MPRKRLLGKALSVLLFRDSLKTLAAWLDNPPLKSQDANLKKETFITIMVKLADLKPDQVEKQLTATLDSKQAITLSKYIFKAFELLDKKDQSKSF